VSGLGILNVSIVLKSLKPVSGQLQITQLISEFCYSYAMFDDRSFRAMQKLGADTWFRW